MPDNSGIQMYCHCRRCIEELPEGQSPESYARITAGFTGDYRLMVWCLRHDMIIVELPVNMTMPRCEHHDHENG